MSLFVSRMATGRSCSSRRKDHRLATTTCVPSALVFLSSPSQRLVRSNSASMSSSGVGKIVCSNSCECLPIAFVGPSVQLLRPPIPVRDDIAHITDEDRVVCQIEQASLLRSLCYFDLEVVAGLNEISLDPPPDGCELGKKPTQIIRR